MEIIATTLNAKYIHTNLAIRLLKANAIPEFNINILEFTIKDPLMSIVTKIFNKKPDIIGFSCYIWNIEFTEKIISTLKKLLPNVVIILGGPEVSYDSRAWLKKITDADIIVRGEGEVTFKEVLKSLQAENDLSKILGITYRKNGIIYKNEKRPLLELTNLPSPHRFSEDILSLANRISYVETSRGCPFSCQFCLSSVEKGVRFFDLTKVKSDLLYLIENGCKTIKFMDRTFNINRDYAFEIFNFFIEHSRPGLSVQFEIIADLIDIDLINYLNEHAPEGLFRFEIGVQSTNLLTLVAVLRKQKFEKLAEVVQLIKKGRKIVQHLDLIAGLPHEDLKLFQKTFDDVFALRPDELQLGFLKLLRGTNLRKAAKKYSYKFCDVPPYEILESDCLAFDDVIKIHQAEEILDKFWNNHRMDLTLEYFFHYVFQSPFDFFLKFGEFWAKHMWSHVGSQVKDLFWRMYCFGVAVIDNTKHLLSIMKWDYLTSQKYKPRSFWWDIKVSEADKKKVQDKLCANPENFLSENDFYKHVVIEKISLDIFDFQKNYKITEKNNYLVVYYDPRSKSTKYWSVNL